MAQYSIGPGEEKTETALKIEGIVASVDWEALREFCHHAFKNTDEVVLDLGKVSEYDFSLTVFVCLLRRTVLNLGKHLTITGRGEEFACQHFKGAQCSNIEASATCWCESLFGRGTPHHPLESQAVD
jgi:hypothetical protein